MKQKGQALIEFILVVPVLLIILIGMIDFGNILYQKYQLENNLDTIIYYYQNNQNQKITEYKTKYNITITTKQSPEETTIKVYKEITINTPILNHILGNPHQIETERTFINE